jgi:hypothetical protein
MKKHRREKPKHEGAFENTPRILTAEEKRSLILAHAAERRPRDPVQRITLWMGVTVALLAVVCGWFLTVGRQVKREMDGTGGELRELADELDTFTERTKTNPVVNPPELPGPTTAAAAAQFEDILREILDSDSTSTRRDDLLAPSAPSSSASDSGAASPSPSFLIDPDAPGLEAGS